MTNDLETLLHDVLRARALQPLTCAALIDAEARLGLGGDWIAGGRVEGAFLSGVALADRVLGLT